MVVALQGNKSHYSLYPNAYWQSPMTNSGLSERNLFLYMGEIKGICFFCLIFYLLILKNDPADEKHGTVNHRPN